MSEEFCTLLAAGDIMTFRDAPETMFDQVRSTLSDADICYGMMIAPHSDQGSRGSSGARGVVPKDVKMLPSLADAGFNLMSFASNHSLDWGADAFLDCISRLEALGIRVIGAGRNISAARAPAVFDVRGVRVAFLSYCSVAPKGYYAAANAAGVAPMRAVTHYEQIEEDQPGTLPRIMTFPIARDLEALIDDIANARDIADVVVLGMHWGLHGQTRIADYEQTVAHAAIDAGADLILGHHTHISKGIEIYREKVIFYGLGDFAIESGPNEHQIYQFGNREFVEEFAEIYGIKHPLIAAGSQYAMIAQCTFSADGVQQIGFIPVLRGPGGEPVPVTPGSDDGKAVVRHVESVGAEAQLTTKFVDDGRMMVVWSRES